MLSNFKCDVIIYPLNRAKVINMLSNIVDITCTLNISLADEAFLKPPGAFQKLSVFCPCRSI